MARRLAVDAYDPVSERCPSAGLAGPVANARPAGTASLQNENYDEAAKTFKNTEWKAAAHYKAGRYEDAAKILEGTNSVIGHYNRGNALARQGRYQEAIQAYQKALELDPEHADARYNKELIEKALEQQKQQREEQQQSGKDSESQSESSQSQQASSDGEDGQDHERESRDQAGGNDNSRQQNTGSESEADASDRSDTESSTESEAHGRPETNDEKASGQDSDRVAPDHAEDRQPPGSEEKEIAADTRTTDETRQAEEQWLRRIPDDPGGLLKRKFYYQYLQRQRTQGAEPRP